MSDDNELPKGWATAPLGVCGTWYGGGTPSKFNDAYWSGGTIPWISPKDMKRLRISDSEDHISTLALQETNVKAFPQGTVLIVIRSGILSRTLPVAVAEVEATMNQDLKGLLPSEGIESTYVAYFLQAEERDILRQCSKHGTTVASIDTTALHSYMLRFAPLQEQRRIVAKIEELFSDLDAGVAALKRAKANLKRYRASVLKSAVEGKLTEQWRAKHPAKEPASALLARILLERRQKWEADQLAKFAAAKKEPPKNWRDKYVEPTPPDTTGLPELPVGWCWASVEQCATDEDNSIIDGPFGSNLKTAHYTDEGPRVIRLQNIGEGIFVDEDAHISWNHFSTLTRHSVKAGEIVVAMLGEMLPRACLVPDHIPPAIVKADCVKLTPNTALIAPYFLMTVLNAHPTRTRASGQIAGVGRPRLNLGKLRPFVIPLPPLVEQVQIAIEVEEKLSQIDAAKSQIEQCLLRSARLRQSILKQAFEGKLVPKDPKDEPAKVLLERLRASKSAHEGNGNATTRPRTSRRGAKSKQVIELPKT
jgi:type I restriction enzyme S subunit